MDAIEKAIRNAFEKGDADDRAFREKVYRSAFAALDRALLANPGITVEVAIKRRKAMQAKIAEIESEFLPAVAAAPPAESPYEEPLAVEPAAPAAPSQAAPMPTLDGERPPAAELSQASGVLPVVPDIMPDRLSPDTGAPVADEVAPDRDELLGWLRRQKLLHVDRRLGFLMVHAGLFPRWTTAQAEEIAREIEDKLHSDGYRRLLRQMFGNKPDLWTPKLRGIDRWRAGINVLTRMRYCDVRGRISFADKGAPGTQRPGLYPWYEVPGRLERDLRVICGHWSTLGRFIGLGIHAIDTGCVWGGALTAMRVDSEEPQFVTIKSERKPAPGKDID